MNLAMNASQLLPISAFEYLDVSAPLQQRCTLQIRIQLCPQLPYNTLRFIAVRTLELNSTM